MNETSFPSAASLLAGIESPGRYVGGEYGQRVKSSSFRIVLGFPELYEVGMSNLGLRILYHLVHAMDDMAPERVFSPWPDMEMALRRSGQPLCSLESGRPVKTAQVLALSVPHELCFTNVLQILDLSGIPLRSADRSEQTPIVLAGGLGICNPAPLHPFIDGFVLGEAEACLGRILSLLRDSQGLARQARLEILAKDPALYVPLCHGSPDQAQRGSARREWAPSLEEMSHLPLRDLVPYLPATHDRIPLEIMRGCSRGCRFCLAGYAYRPKRERSPEFLGDALSQWVRHTGHEQVALLSLSSSDYSSLSRLLDQVEPLCSRESVAISLPSLRADAMPVEELKRLSRLGRFGLTIAPEAGSQRMRDRINKNLSEQQILQAVQSIFDLKKSSLKMYFMVGLPDEEEKDLEDLVSMLKVLSSHRGMEARINLGCFVPKPHTPFQWESFAGVSSLTERISWLQDRLKSMRRVRWKKSNPESSAIEAILARGDGSLSQVIQRVYEEGARFDGWTDLFKFQIWKQALGEAGMDVDRPFGGRPPSEERLPWDVMDMGLQREFLLSEKRKSLGGETTPECSPLQCHGCGLGCKATAPSPEARPSEAPRLRVVSSDAHPQKVRVRFARGRPLHLIGHLDWTRAVARLLRRSLLPVQHDQGFVKRPRISFGPALPMGCLSQTEYVDILMETALPTAQIHEALSSVCPPGVEVLDVTEVALNHPAPEASARFVLYAFEIDPGEDISQKVIDFQARPELWVTRKRTHKDQKVNLRELVLWHRISPASDTLWVAGTLGSQGTFRPEEFAAEVLGWSPERLLEHPPLRWALPTSADGWDQTGNLEDREGGPLKDDSTSPKKEDLHGEGHGITVKAF